MLVDPTEDGIIKVCYYKNSFKLCTVEIHYLRLVLTRATHFLGIMFYVKTLKVCKIILFGSPSHTSIKTEMEQYFTVHRIFTLFHEAKITIEFIFQA